MDFLLKKLQRSPVLARIVPFAVFVALTFLQGKLGAASVFWIYPLKTVVGAWLVWLVWPWVPEMRWKLSWEGVVVGVVVFAIWVGIDGLYPKFFKDSLAWNPLDRYGKTGTLGWMFVLCRILGSSLVVPPLEEVFYRSFIYRYLVNPDFQSVPFDRFRWMPFIVTSVLFAVEHSQWLAGVICGFAYQGLVCRKNRLGDAMTAHAITNLLLGFWVVWKGAWQFW